MNQSPPTRSKHPLFNGLKVAKFGSAFLSLWLIVLAMQSGAVLAGTVEIELTIENGHFNPSPLARPIIVTARFDQIPGPPPTGTITIGDGVTHCTVVLPDTYCAFTPSVGGSISLVGDYSGDSYYAASSSAPVLHYVDDSAPELLSFKDTSYPHSIISGSNITPDISNDGRYTVFIQQRRGNFYVQRFDRFLQKTTQLYRLTQPDLTSPSIAADGQRVAFLRSDVVYLYTEESQTATAVSASGSSEPVISDDGRWVAFVSTNDQGLADDTNGVADVFVRKISNGAIERISISSSGEQADLASFDVAISGTGRFVAFASNATNLVAGDSNSATDIFVRDRTLGTTRRISVTEAEEQANGGSINPGISANGRFVSFESDATNLTAEDNNNRADVSWVDANMNQIRLLSRTLSGASANNHSRSPSISSSGRFVTFRSAATDLVTEDNNQRWDTFVWDRVGNNVEIVSLSTDGTSGDGNSETSSISSDGRMVVFSNKSTTLHPEATTPLYNVYLRDRGMRSTNPISAITDGFVLDRDSIFLGSSSDARYVSYGTWSDNLFPEHSSHRHDLVKDRNTGHSMILNERPDGSHFGVNRWGGTSFDGQLMALETVESLHPRDRNNRSDAYVLDLSSGDFEWVSQDTGVGRLISVEHTVLSRSGRFVAYVIDEKGHVYDRVERSTKTLIASPVDSIHDITPNGRYVTFSSYYVLYRYDTQEDSYEQVTIAADGSSIPGVGGSMSSNGNLVLFDSFSSIDSDSDVFIRNMRTHTTRRVNIAPNGDFFDGDSYGLEISRDGRIVSMTNDGQVYVRNLYEQRTTLVSVDQSGTPGNGPSIPRWMSRDGQLIIIESRATNFAQTDPNPNVKDLFIMRNLGANYGPVVAPDYYTVLEDHALEALDADGLLTTTINDDGLLANDFDEQGDGFTVTTPSGQITLGGVGGTVLVQSNGTFTYTPINDANGIVVFDYEVTDAYGLSSIGMSEITVQAVNDAPRFDPGSAITVDRVGEHNLLWAESINPGAPDELNQSLTFEVTLVSNDGLHFSTLPSISSDGVVHFILSPSSEILGRAVFSVQLLDDGGVENGGIDRSPQIPLAIDFAD